MTRIVAESLPLWVASADLPTFAPLRRDVQTDVCVVGAGIAGLCTAYLLAKEGRRVVVVTQEGVGQGETMRTSAHLTAALDSRYFRLESLHGEAGACLAASSHATAIDRIEKIIQQEHIDCAFARVDGYLVAASDQAASEIDREREAARRAGIDVEILAHCPGAAILPGPCLRFPRQAQFHPLEFLAVLTRAIDQMGGQIYTDTHVDTVTGGTTVEVQASGGSKVTARTAVVATETPVSNILTLHTKQAAYRTYAVAAPVAAGLLPPALYWDTAEPYHYVRTHTMVNQDHATDMLIVGGEDHKTGQADDTEARYDRLETWMEEHFPMAGDIGYRWSGQVIEPYDGLAFIGRNPGDDNVFVVTGTSGNGMTYGMIAAMVLSDLIAGRDNPWAKLYDPSRITLRAAPQFLRENINVAVKYAELAMPAEVSSEDDIPRNCGGVIRQGVSKVAVYRDETGHLYRYSAVCTHLNCIVHWNMAEQSWDCPCHGSRYSRFGKVINGPAIKDLEPMQ
jgi:glycine/D-amino acid oxidase-like deaminating enzyme/nitrite reductase/ring-hydroxylating ferredoxin subunit